MNNVKLCKIKPIDVMGNGKMAKETEVKRTKLKELVLAVTRAIVAEEGFSQLNVRKIATGADCSVGMIYNLFSGLDDLILTVNAQTLDDVYALLAEEAQKEKEPDKAVQRLGACYIAYANERYNLWSMLFEHRMEADLPDWYEEKMVRNFKLVEEVMAPIMGEGATSSDVERAAKVLWAGLHGICSLSITGKLDTVGAESAQVLAESFITNYVRGLRG